MKPTLLLCLIGVATLATATPAQAHRAQSPMTLSVTGPDRVTAGAAITLQVKLKRTSWKAMPLQLSLKLPAGVRLVAGGVAEKIVDTKATVLVRTVQLAVDKLPTDDLMVAVDGEGKGAGIHLQAWYRFGRKAATVPADPKGPSIQVGNIKVSPGKPLKPD